MKNLDIFPTWFIIYVSVTKTMISFLNTFNLCFTEKHFTLKCSVLPPLYTIFQLNFSSIKRSNYGSFEIVTFSSRPEHLLKRFFFFFFFLSALMLMDNIHVYQKLNWVFLTKCSLITKTFCSLKLSHLA